MSFLTRGPIDVSDLLESLAAPEVGGVVLFSGRVRNLNGGRAVAAIDYSAYETMAEEELGRIVQEASSRYPGVRVLVRHRLGRLVVGEVSVAVAAAHPHRGPAFDAARYVIEELKKRVPIWKCEEYVDGTREWVDPTRIGVQ
ncbi:MAG TPA: molybdenum cofactor biosynthesis protein MoaE [Gemmatimonadaceae bacterium]|nr:molybdenum cofactor biosynthesis protein MoaE [Gemmatimonadaceae bacterium]